MCEPWEDESMAVWDEVEEIPEWSEEMQLLYEPILCLYRGPYAVPSDEG